MKKLLIALAAVAVAAGAQAAAFSWKTSATGKVYTPGDSSTLLASATAYLFDVNTVSQGSLVTAFNAGTLDLSSESKLSSQSISSGAIAKTEFNDSTPAGNNMISYFAAIVKVDNKDYLYISNTATGAAQQSATTALSFRERAASQAAVMDATGGYMGAGWYTAVPEPTSGLLMLIGMAGLALRRKRA